MTKSKKFWAILAVISLAAAGFSGYSIYNRLTIYFANDTMEVRPKPVPMLPDVEETKEDSDQITAKIPESQPAPKETREEPQKQKAIKTAFEYKNASARSVSLAGSFTKWKEIRMTKKNGVWKAEVYILPGNYLYHFAADGKKVLDPSKPKGPVGESIAVIEAVHPATGRK